MLQLNECRISILKNYFKKSLFNHQYIFNNIECFEKEIFEIANLLIKTIKNSGKILICGNGGSAADSQHMAAEFMGRFELEREPISAVALTTDTSILTSISNDYDFSNIFSRLLTRLHMSCKASLI